MLIKMLLQKIKLPLSLREAFPFCHSRESGNPYSLSLRGAKQACPSESRGSNLNGFSLIELMVAVVILALAIFGIFQAYSVGFMGMADARDRTVATNYAQEKMEDIKNKPFGEIVDDPANPDDPPADIPEQTKFKRKVTITKDVDGSIEDLKKVTTTVSWDNRKGESKSVSILTLIYNK